MYVCIINQEGKILAHKNLPTDPEAFLKLIEPYREDIIVGVECVFLWYWLADLCADEGIPFILGHALYMKAIHGGKAKNDKIDSEKIARLIRGGMFSIAYVYPRKMRADRDLLRRRNYFVRRRVELLAHIQNTNSQYNLEPIGRRLDRKKIGNVHLKWAFSEAAVLFLRANPRGQQYLKRLEKKHGTGKALSIIGARLGRAVYFMLQRGEPFNKEKFYAS